MRKKNQKLKKTGTIHDTITGYDFRVDKPLSPKKAIRLRCLDCCAGSSMEVKKCPASDCGNWPHRLGRGVCIDPKGEIILTVKRSGAQIAAAHSNMARLQEKRGNGTRGSTEGDS